MQERTPEAYRAALLRLQLETQRLETLAQSLILTTRDDAAIAVNPVDIGVAAEHAAEHMQPLASARGIALTCGVATGIDVVGDADMLERAIVVLIDNALRFARKRVDVTVDATGDVATIVVRDDGPGFSDAARDAATQRFWRDDPARSGSGTGLGLAIARSIAERHRGTLALDNATVGTGAVVTLTLPAAAAATV
jgi:two-component system sensor histidine kinase TctE